VDAKDALPNDGGYRHALEGFNEPLPYLLQGSGQGLNSRIDMDKCILG
jgi:hypothetical protein